MNRGSYEVWAPSTPRHATARRPPGDRVIAPGIGQVVVKPDPERDPRAGRAAGGGDPARIDSQLVRLVSDKLDRPCTVEHRGRERRRLRQPIVRRGDRDPRIQALRYQPGGNARLVAAAEPAAVEEDHQRRRDRSPPAEVSPSRGRARSARAGRSEGSTMSGSAWRGRRAGTAGPSFARKPGAARQSNQHRHAADSRTSHHRCTSKLANRRHVGVPATRSLRQGRIDQHRRTIRDQSIVYPMPAVRESIPNPISISSTCPMLLLETACVAIADLREHG